MPAALHFSSATFCLVTSVYKWIQTATFLLQLPALNQTETSVMGGRGGGGVKSFLNVS